jgi:hypothetical protein
VRRRGARERDLGRAGGDRRGGDARRARAVALVERMLCSALSPLYGNDAGVLREELRRLEFLLSR